MIFISNNNHLTGIYFDDEQQIEKKEGKKNLTSDASFRGRCSTPWEIILEGI